MLVEVAGYPLLPATPAGITGALAQRNGTRKVSASLSLLCPVHSARRQGGGTSPPAQDVADKETLEMRTLSLGRIWHLFEGVSPRNSLKADGRGD